MSFFSSELGRGPGRGVGSPRLVALLAIALVGACNVALPLGELTAGCPAGQRACNGKCVPAAAGTDCTLPGGDGGSTAIPVTAIASNAGASHTCAVLEGGTVRCWGSHDSGQLGDAAPCSVNQPCTSQATPVVVKLDEPVDAIAVGQSHSCARTMAGAVWCWGSNKQGQLGLGQVDTVAHATPAKVPGLEGVKAVSAGSGSTCAILTDGSLRCWGDNSFGQLGIPANVGGNNQQPSPVVVPGVSSVALVTGGSRHTCAMETVGNVSTLLCSGSNEFGQLGLPLTETQDLCAGNGGTQCSNGFKQFINATDVKGFSCGTRHTCVLRQDGSVQCSGRAQDGELGIGQLNKPPQFSPQPIDLSSGALSFASIVSGASHTCGVLGASNLIACWGLNTKGDVFTPTATQALARPTTLPSAGTADSVAAGAGHTCVLSKGIVSCVGANDVGQLGRGSARDDVFDTASPVINL